MSRSATSAPATAPAGQPATASYEQVKKWIEAYKATHRGNGGKDWDINAKSPEEVEREPDTKRLLSLCGPNQRPVIPALAWEYGGSDHRWTKPETAALCYCVYTPVEGGSEHWRFDETKNRVVADLYVKFPDRNPCKDRTGKDQVLGCLGDATNLEILVDTASLHDGRDVGYELSEAATELRLVLPNGKKVQIVLAK
jgi:hypothetical protein